MWMFLVSVLWAGMPLQPDRHSERFILSDGNVGEDLDGQLPSRLSAEFDFDLNWKDLYWRLRKVAAHDDPDGEK
jgi:hypothetical protein